MQKSKNNLFHSLSNPYSGGGAFSSANGTTWNAIGSGDQDFFFRVYFTPSPVTTPIPVNVQFKEGEGRGVISNKDGALTTDAKLLIALVIDDTASAVWSDPNGNRLTALPDLITSLFERTPATSGGDPYNISYADFWSFASYEKEYTSGFENDLDKLELNAATLVGRGTKSNLFETASIAISGINPQSVVDALLKSGDTAGNADRMDKLVAYLDERDLLNVEEVYEYWSGLDANTRSAWGESGYSGGTEAALKATISSYDDVSQYVAMEWAKTFTPVAIIIADGDDSSSTSAFSTALTAQSMWDDDGVPVYTFGMGRSHTENGLRLIASLTGGKHFAITDGTSLTGDWQKAIDTLLHGGNNNLFTGIWRKSYDYAEPTWIRHFESVFDAPTNGAEAKVEVRWTFDRLNYTPWQQLASGVKLILNDQVLGVEYRITLTDGWNAGTPVRPKVTSLGHQEVSPAVHYYVTPPQKISGMMLETLLSATVDLPRTARARWRIARGNTADYAEYEDVHNGRKGALPNRQQSVAFTAKRVRQSLKCTRINETTYQVYEDNGSPAKWVSTDVVQVYQGPAEVNPNAAQYSLDGALGRIYFTNEVPTQVTVTCTVTTPPQLYVSVGEPTTTRDGRTYYAANGRWPHDAEIIVLVNGAVKHGGWYANPDEGTITFAKERESTDLVTVYVLHNDLYRVAVEIRDFGDPDLGDAVPVVDNFGLFYSVLSNVQIEDLKTPKTLPYIIDAEVKLLPTTGSIYERLRIEYKFAQDEGNDEKGTEVSWWLYRLGYSIPGGSETQVVDGKTFFRITPDSLPAYSPDAEYDNRTSTRKVDVKKLDDSNTSLFEEGDLVFVEVTPSDSFHAGATIRSNVVEMHDYKTPYVESGHYDEDQTKFVGGPFIDAIGRFIQDGLAYAYVGVELQAVYVYHNPQNPAADTPDNSVIEWFLKDNPTTVFATGTEIAEGVTQAGQVFVFRVTPYNGTTYGVPVWSEDITITKEV